MTPATGNLTPAFDPEIYQYNLAVPFEVTTMTFTAEAPEGATYRVNRKNLGAGGSDTVFEITVTAADGETRQVYTVTVHRSEKAVSTGGAGTGSGSSGGGSASQSSGDGDSDTSSGGTEASPERESTEETVPVAGGVGESSSPGGGGRGRLSGGERLWGTGVPKRGDLPAAGLAGASGLYPVLFPLRALGQDAGQALPPKGGAHREITAKKRRCPFGQRLFCQEFFCWARRRRCCTRTSLPKNSSLP